MVRSVVVALRMLVLAARRSTSLLLAAALLCLSAPAQAERYTIPWFEPPSAGGDPQGVLRIVNAAADAGTVTIHAIDDAGVRTGTAVLALNGSAAVDISAMELQTGDVAVGAGTGYWSNLSTTPVARSGGIQSCRGPSAEPHTGSRRAARKAIPLPKRAQAHSPRRERQNPGLRRKP